VEPTFEMICELTDNMNELSLQLEAFGDEYTKAVHSLNDAISRTKKKFQVQEWEKKRKGKAAIIQTSLTAFFGAV
jgi:hypothetical protein